MKSFLMIMGALIICSSLVFAAGPKTYQVTGPVLEAKDDSITVQKGKEKWEIAKDAATKVTIEYTMKAATIEVKDAAKKAESKKTEPAPAKVPAKK
ncbi:MAG: hypothetical protein GXY80_15040 [Syntrophorhabdus aromaticivorans]|uniref:DUF5666 domain-containing protein n=1 Tax=Syntrophorhabdus aromaticivorans TaxID=328301 RepID=A0A971M7Q5_9BACT|nr:hypothetical protein [Syntrophorhabdus aromaticivorans]